MKLIAWLARSGREIEESWWWMLPGVGLREIGGGRLKEALLS